MATGQAIHTSGLTKRYGDLTAVDNLSFHVNKGEIFGFLGPNGSGKTTTIRMLVGLSKPSEGRASVLGLDMSSRATEAKRHIGVVPDISNLYDELSARDNLIFMAKLYGIPRSQREARAEDLLKTFGLYERRNDRFGTFSRGMKRSLTIAAALIHNPKILFLDEPTAGLDVVAARSLRNLISNLCREGMTIFLTTHYLEEADQLCDRIAILVKGRIVKIDTPEGLKCLAQEKQAIEFTFERDITPWREELSRRLRTGMAEINVLASDRVKVYGGEPGRIYDEVFQFSRERGIRLNAVNSVKPSLEDAFMLITGLSPVVMAMEKGGR